MPGEIVAVTLTNVALNRNYALRWKGLLEWLQQDYGLSLKEGTRVIGTSIHYRIPSLAGPKYEVAAMLERRYRMD